VQQDTEVLKKLFSDEDLPRDYGGRGPTLQELNGTHGNSENVTLLPFFRFDNAEIRREWRSFRPARQIES
jgi:hypothetical protein